MKINATEIRVGMILEYKNDLWEVLKTQHVKPGKGGAFAQVEMKSLNKNTKLNERFRSSETVEKATLEEIKLNFLSSNTALSTLSLDLNLSFNFVPFFTLLSSTWLKAPPFPGLTCWAFKTDHKSFLCSIIIPGLISFPNIFILFKFIYSRNRI